MKNEEPWFVEERAIAFAKLALTKRHKATVRAYAGRHVAIDLLVEIPKNGKSTLRFFGVQIVGYLDLPDVQAADERVMSHLGRDPFEADLPICVFVIGVRKPQGIYRWIAEPVIIDGQPVLQSPTNAAWEVLDESAADKLIRQVNAWYDARAQIAGSQRRDGESKAQSG